MNHSNDIVIQTNLQVLYTPRMDPQKLVGAVADMGANALVYNVGGIYAWYPTEVPFHAVNPYLPKGRDLLTEVIETCHQKGMKLIARFDFSKAEDRVYAQRPWWFVKTISGDPEIIGAKRPGNWSLLMSTCINSAYRDQAVAIPILKEVLAKYDIDGVFLNNPGFIPCYCENCRQRYRQIFNADLPEQVKDFHPDWQHLCVHDNIQKLQTAMKASRADLPLILYYTDDARLAYRLEVADQICAEPQDILSLGRLKIPDITKPILHIKKGRTVEEKLVPYGIIHSSPGMDWRHTGLPTAEYEYWLSLITASGGNIWHSLTGFDLTITDKRILTTVTRFNQRIRRVSGDMEGALSDSEVVLLWNASPSAVGIANGLINRQIPFDLILNEQLTLAALKKYRLLILPENGLNESNIEMVTSFVKTGGRLLLEGSNMDVDGIGASIRDLLGFDGNLYRSGELAATYLRFAGDSALDSDARRLRQGFENTELIALRGIVGYITPRSTAKVLLTQVPPFAPVDSVGAPPERASLLVAETDIPMLILNTLGQGKVLYLPFSLSTLINDYRLAEHYNLLSNMINLLLEGTRRVAITPIQGLYIAAFKKGRTQLVHLVNGAGSRPLVDNLPLYDLKLRIKQPEADHEQYEVTALISGAELSWVNLGGTIEISIPRLDVWECLKINPK